MANSASRDVGLQDPGCGLEGRRHARQNWPSASEVWPAPSVSSVPEGERPDYLSVYVKQTPIGLYAFLSLSTIFWLRLSKTSNFFPLYFA